MRAERAIAVRVRFVLLAAVTVALGLIVVRVKADLPGALGDVLGDALWAMMMAWLVGAALPAWPAERRAGVALAICWIVEFGQLYHAGWLDAWRRTTLGHLVLGTDFDARDLVAYAAGVAGPYLIERMMFRKSRR